MILLRWLLKPDEECFRKTFYTIDTSMYWEAFELYTLQLRFGWICCSKNPFSALFNYWKRCKFGQTFLFNKPNYIESLCRWAEFWPLTIKAYFGRWFSSLKPLLCANILFIMDFFRHQEGIRVQKLFNFEDTVLTFCSFDTALYFCVVI